MVKYSVRMLWLLHLVRLSPSTYVRPAEQIIRSEERQNKWS